jgi:prophage regulatory protein
MSRPQQAIGPQPEPIPSPVDVLLQLPEVCHQAGFGKTAIYRMIKEGTFPEPIKLGPASRWSQLEVQEWIQKQKAARRAA